MTVSGIVTKVPSKLDAFTDTVARSGESVEASDHLDAAVAFSWTPGENLGSAISPQGSIAVVAFSPPLAAGSPDDKAKATLASCQASGEPIENDLDQCSVAFWDQAMGKLLLYRDWRGGPTLFYDWDGHTLRWSTSIRKLLDLGAARRPDRTALMQLQMVGYVPAPRTLAASINKVPAGHVLSLRNGQLQIRRHWTPSWGPKLASDIGGEVEAVRELLTESTARMASGTGATGIFLSGGIDSAVVAAVARKSAGIDLSAFTYRYEDYTGEFNEGPAAAKVARALAIPHEEISIGPGYLMDNLPLLVTLYEEPMTYGIHSARMNGIKEAGIDTLLSGVDAPGVNLSKAYSAAFDVGNIVPRPLLLSAKRLTSRAPSGPVHRAFTLSKIAGASIVDNYLEHPLHKVVPYRTISELHGDPVLFDAALEELRAGLQATAEEAADLNRRDQLALLGLTGSGPELVLMWNHRWSEAHDVAIRYPLYDGPFIEHASRRKKRSSAKEDLRRLAEDYLPVECARTPKVPQSIPLGEWFRGPMRDYLRSHLTKNSIDADGTFDSAVVLRQLDEHLEGRADHKWALWTCLGYFVWREHVLDASGGTHRP